MSCIQYDPNPSVASYEDISDELIFGESQPMQLIQAKLTSVATSKVPVLIHGESGTGKELLARIIHRYSALGNQGTFVKVNCPALPASLFESELFGYEKGAFTGAYGKKPGRVALANQGTLFLDEISEIDSHSQAKLLQLLQDGSFCSIGGQQDTKVEIRVICATNRDLDVEVGNGNFRQDLYYRINVVNLRLPSLRERRSDIPNLVSHFIGLFNHKFNCRAKPLSAELLSALQAYHWPGNIRQLENMMKRYAILGSEEVIASELNSRTQASQTFTSIPHITAGESISLKDLTRDMVRDLERQVITKMLEAHRWNRAQAARALNISYRALLYKVKSSQLVSPRVGSSTEQ
jgi:two-component system response regulator AtoC